MFWLPLNSACSAPVTQKKGYKVKGIHKNKLSERATVLLVGIVSAPKARLARTGAGVEWAGVAEWPAWEWLRHCPAVIQRSTYCTLTFNSEMKWKNNETRGRLVVEIYSPFHLTCKVTYLYP